MTLVSGVHTGQHALVAERPEDLVARVAGENAEILGVVIDGALALVVAESADGTEWHCHCELVGDRWQFTGGGGGGRSAEHAQHYSWVRSTLAPPGVVGAGWRTDADEVVLALGDERIVIQVHDGAFAWLRGGVSSNDSLSTV